LVRKGEFQKWLGITKQQFLSPAKIGETAHCPHIYMNNLVRTITSLPIKGNNNS